MDLSKKMSYEISLWEEFPNERKICVLGSNEFRSQQNIFEPVFTKKVDGANTLTFSIYAKYFDKESKQMIANPLVQFLHNESKIKLKYFPHENSAAEWYDFVIKKVDESSDKCKVSYTATDFYVNELAKTGFNLEFDTELENNIGTVQELATTVLDGTGWEVDSSESIIDEKEEGLFKLNNPSQVEASPDGDHYFIFYSSTLSPTHKGFQILKVKGDIKHSSGVITNGSIIYSSTKPTYTSTLSEYRAMAQVWTQKTMYDKVLDKYVQLYKKNGQQYASYFETDYKTPKDVCNCITNGYSITTDSGWCRTDEKSLQIKCLPAITKDNFTTTTNRSYGIKLENTTDKLQINLFNSGLTDNIKKVFPISTDKNYIVRFKIVNNLNLPYSSAKPKLTVAKYTYSNGKFEVVSGSTIFSAELTYDSNSKFYKAIAKFTKQVQLSEVNDDLEKYGVFINFSPTAVSTFYLTQAEFFEEIINESGATINPYGFYVENKNNTSINYPDESVKKEIYYYYRWPHEDTISSKEDITYSHIGSKQTDYISDYTNEKRRSITARESNRFNLLQTLAENFEVWCLLDIQRDTEGKVVSKSVKFVKTIGNTKEVPTIKYGLNLKSIKRSLDSNKIATKLIVKNNNNEFATDGSCSIARANLNPTKQNFVYNFDYYTNKNLVNQTQLNQDLVELNSFLNEKYNESKPTIEKQGTLAVEYSKYKSDYINAKAQYEATQEALVDLKDELHELTTFTYDEFQNINTNPTTSDKYKKLDEFLGKNDVIALITDIQINSEKLTTYENDYDLNKEQFETTKTKISNNETTLSDINTEIADKISQFESKYRSLIQEASWISEEHIDNDLYYIDAEGVLRGSAFPKVTYTIDAIDLGYHPDFKYFHYNIADVIMVEDTENFGWAPATGEAFREEFVITEVKIHFETPEKNSIATKNYRTSFQDLFQRFAATTQQLQFHEGDWNKVSKVVQGNQITSESLQSAFSSNANTLANVTNQSVIWDERGITTTNTAIPSEVTRITSSGIFLTDSGGRQWTTGITAKGINAKIITTGQLNTDNVVIMSGRNPAFKWDKVGLNAIAQDNGTPNLNKFVRFDQYGMYGVNSQAHDVFWVPEPELNKTVEQVITENSSFYLGWDGVHINKGTISIGGTAELPNFKVYDNGDVELNGSITWGANASPTKVVYASYTGDGKTPGDPENDSYYIEHGEFPYSSGAGAWHTHFDSATDKFASYSYDGGTTWGDVIKTVGEDGTNGASNYALSLDNDFDTLVKDNAGTWLSQESKVNITGYYGSTKKTLTANTVTVTAPTTGWNEGSLTNVNNHYNVTITDGVVTLEIKRVPSGFSDGEFVIQWKNGSTIYDTKKFRLQTVTSLADYDLLIPQTVFNNTNTTSNTTISFKILKKTKDGTATLDSIGTEPLKIFINGSEATGFSFSYNKNTTSFTIQLKSTDETILWDEEVIEFVKNGENGENGENGANGKTIKTVSAYYLSSEPTRPDEKDWPVDGKAPTGNWKTAPQGLTDGKQYEYISMCTVIDDAYGEWTDPVLYARYGKDGKPGDPASVNAENVFNALTSDGTKFGCFGNANGELYINANFINAGILTVKNGNTEIFRADINDKKVEIGDWQVEDKTLANYDDDGNKTIFLSSIGIQNSKYKVANNTRKWCIWSNGTFGVTNTGSLYASDVHIGNTTGTSYLKFDETNGLQIKAKSIVLESGGRIGNPNLLFQTEPAETFKLSQTDYNNYLKNAVSLNKQLFYKYWECAGTDQYVSIIENEAKNSNGDYSYPQAAKWGKGRTFRFEETGTIDQSIYLTRGTYTFSGYCFGKVDASLRDTEDRDLVIAQRDFSGNSNIERVSWTFEVAETKGYYFRLSKKSDYQYAAYWFHPKLEKGKDASAWEVGEGEYSSSLSMSNNLMVASVHNGTDGFSWELKPEGFILKKGTGSSTSQVFVCDSNGLEINGKGTFRGNVYADNGYFKGEIEATKGTFKGNVWTTNGQIGGWYIKEDSLVNGALGATGGFHMYANTKGNGTDKTIAGDTRSDWRLVIGTKFGVDGSGGIHAIDGKFKGRITATSGEIGAWEITGTSGSILKISQDGADIGDIGGQILTDQLGYWKKTGESSFASKSASWEAVVMSAWHWQNEHSSESDINVKNSISSLDLTYDELFDNLKPCKYKYNHGTSDRYHTGFIAQETKEAIESVGLTTQDFAGVVHLKEPNENGCEWLLRRDEFVALNTWQIQKLKTRVKELEEKLAQLEIKGGSLND